jgi:hypothetical protein
MNPTPLRGSLASLGAGYRQAVRLRNRGTMGTLAEIIEKAGDRNLLAEDFDAAARSIGVAPSDLTDMFARTVAEDYQLGRLSWAVADAAMNWLFFDYGVHSNREGVLTPLAERVFEAFDEGEYKHLGEPENRQGESRTRALLEWAITGDERHLSPFRPEATVPLVQAAAVSIAKRALAGSITAIDAVRELLPLRHRMEIQGDDPDFSVLARIEERTANLPFGDFRSLWAPDALREKDREIAVAEEWAQGIGRPALLSIVQRFGGAA